MRYPNARPPFPVYPGGGVDHAAWQHPISTHVDAGVPGCNIFIRGLKPDATDELLQQLCQRLEYVRALLWDS